MENINEKIASTQKLTKPISLLKSLPSSPKINSFVKKTRNKIRDILNGKSDKKLLIVGPCSIHDFDLACAYGIMLKKIADKVSDKILIVMRVYFEKPRTTVGWKGLINDPGLDNSFNINSGLRLARNLLLFLNSIELPCAYEILDTFTPQFIGDLISWGAIGARTCESQVHRQMVSGLSIPVGFKNSSSGDYDAPVNSIISASHPHCFYGIDFEGKAIILNTKGNEDCHIILRGSRYSTNYDIQEVQMVGTLMNEANLRKNVMVDCSHGNSGKDYTKQKEVFNYVCTQLENNYNYVIGMMLESNINEGKQKLVFGKKEELKYGVSITDSCINIQETENLILHLWEIL